MKINPLFNEQQKIFKSIYTQVIIITSVIIGSVLLFGILYFIVSKHIMALLVFLWFLTMGVILIVHPILLLQHIKTDTQEKEKLSKMLHPTEKAAVEMQLQWRQTSKPIVQFGKILSIILGILFLLIAVLGIGYWIRG